MVEEIKPKKKLDLGVIAFSKIKKLEARISSLEEKMDFVIKPVKFD